MAQQVSIPKGTRDFGPEVMRKREFIFDTLKTVFRSYGYEPIETPSIEQLSTLLGKYGEEGDKLLFRILNSGDYLSDVPAEILENPIDFRKILPYICDKGLRYDLTVPFARFVVMNRHEITFPFRRYQIQPVWRADRPQKGRYREFYQCDVDVIGTSSMLNEFELILIVNDVFQKLGLKVTLLINNRKILDGILQNFGLQNNLNDIAIAIDKLEKIGQEGVVNELQQRGIEQSIALSIMSFITLKGSPQLIVDQIKPVVKNTVQGANGIAELEELIELLQQVYLNIDLELDLSLARGLDYYTGAIFEVKAKDVQMGSICGGGRYDNLTRFFGLNDMSGVGISFGADRIYDVMNELRLFPENLVSSTRVLFLNFGKKELHYVLPFLSIVRQKGISAEIYPEAEKIKKQFNYAHRKNIPFVVIAGENEMNSGTLVLKKMDNGEQQIIRGEQLIELLQTID